MSLRVSILAALALILGLPFALSLARDGQGLPSEGPRLVVYTPHVQQIRWEFAHAFSAWHKREFGESAVLDFRTPGGTSEIRRQLAAQYIAALKQGKYELVQTGDGYEVAMPPGTIEADLFFGGGSYDHGELKRGVRYVFAGAAPDGTDLELDVPMSVPASFSQPELDELYGENVIGPQTLYEPEQYWIGTALSSFGIVYNTELLASLGLPEPEAFGDLTDCRLLGSVALADPRQSGSITTTFDSILGNAGWDEGWRLLRAMCGNTRYFTNSATKPPSDVSQGEAAAGLAIDFYGRGQAQTAGRGRVGYADPAGAVYVDADPVTLLRGGPNYELAMRFVRFTLTDEAQALWQFPSLESDREGAPPSEATGEPLGPLRYELRRMPVRRAMYDRYFDRFKDKVVPFEIVSRIENPGWRTGVQVMMGCFAADIAEQTRAAYEALCDARGNAAFPPETLAAMERAYFAFPPTPVDAEGAFTSGEPVERLAWTESNYRAVRNSWRPDGAQRRAEIYYTRWFRERYAEVIEMRDTREPAGLFANGPSGEPGDDA
ncbi:MAG: extracellular solute-binding protein [Planctomycetota bacterium]